MPDAQLKSRRTPATAAVGPRPSRSASRRFELLAFAGPMLAALAGWFIADLRLLLTVAGSVLAVIFALTMRNPRFLLPGLFVWLVPLGLVRRMLSSGALVRFDPLLFVGPLVVTVLAWHAARQGAFRQPTALSKAVGLLSILILLGALNPAQGSLAAGVVGLFFTFVPLLGFWIGRGLEEVAFRRLIVVVMLLAIPAALYGLSQTFRGYPSWDAAWLENSGDAALYLYIGEAIRPFGTFASAAEYAFFLSIALIGWLLVGKQRSRVLVAVVPMLGVALFLEASRGVVVLLALALGLIFTARWRLPLLGSVAAGGALILGLSWGLQGWSGERGSGAGSLVAHQVGGLSRPFDSATSSLPGHIESFRVGMSQALEHPLGQGISTISLAGRQLGRKFQNTETDLSNAATALGLPGLAAYACVLVLGFRTVWRLARRRRDPLALVALGIIAVMLLQWLHGGYYAVALLPWISLGWADRQWQSLPTAVAGG